MANANGQKTTGRSSSMMASHSRSAGMLLLLAFVQATQSTRVDDESARSGRRLLAAQQEEFSMQQPQVITRPAGAPLMKAAVAGKPVYYFQPSQSQALGAQAPPTYVIDPRILRKAQLNTLKARLNHARNRAQSLAAEGDEGSILDVAAFVFVAVGGTLLVFIRVGIPSAFVK